jgi:hypothetical protein
MFSSHVAMTKHSKTAKPERFQYITGNVVHNLSVFNTENARQFIAATVAVCQIIALQRQAERLSIHDTLNFEEQITFGVSVCCFSCLGLHM